MTFLILIAQNVDVQQSPPLKEDSGNDSCIISEGRVTTILRQDEKLAAI
jgi:hypothetical protein